MNQNLFLEISVLLGITITIAFVIRAIKQPLMVAYIMAGIIAGPLFLNLINGGLDIYQGLSQFGVVLLLFLIGLSLNFNYLKKIGGLALLAGLMQAILTSGIGFLIIRGLGFSFWSAVYLAVAITFSSTIIIIKLLNDKRHAETVYGRYTIGLMLVQDVIALAILIGLSLFAPQAGTGELLSWIAFKALMILLIVFIAYKFILPHILDKIAGNGEFLFIFTVAWCFGVANLIYFAGFPLEIGAIIAGLSLGSSAYQPEISSRLKPLRDFFLVLFFIILGSQLSLSNLNTIWQQGLWLTVFIVFGNPLILYFIFRLLKFTRRNSFLICLNAAQVSEFGFVLLLTAGKLGLLNGTELPVFTMMALLSIIISSYLITYNDQLYKLLRPWFKLFGPDKRHQREEAERTFEVIVFGYHRLGWKICEGLIKKKATLAVVDFNPETINKLNKRGLANYFGDAGDVEFLETLPIEQAKMIICTIPETDDQVNLFRYVKSVNKKALIIASTYHTSSLKELYRSGADYVMVPHLLGGEWMSEVLKHKSWTKLTFNHLKKAQDSELKLKESLNIRQE